MKKYNEIVLAVTAALGLAGGWLHRQLLTLGVDAEGLLIPGCGWGYGLVALTAVFAVFALFVVKKLENGGDFFHNFPKCKIRFTLILLGAGLFLLYGLGQLRLGESYVGLAAMAAAAGILWASFGRLSGKAPLPLAHIVVCLFFILRLILSFQGWSADPQFQDYAMKMLALVSLMLFAFHRASWDAGMGKRRACVFFELASVYFSLTALGAGEMSLLLTGSALWAVGAGVNLEAIPAEDE